MTLIPLLPAALATLAGCGGYPTADDGASESGMTVITTQSLEEYASTADVRCGEPGAVCERAVAQIYTRKAEREIGICTAFFIDADLMVTNSHCVPPSLTPGSSCAGAVIAKLPATGILGPQLIACAAVVDRSPRAERNHQDYALLRMAAPVSGRQAFSASMMGVAHGETVTVHRITPFPQGHGGTVGTLSCIIQRTTQFSPRRGPRANDLEYLDLCPVVRGNSGSVVMNAAGHAVGIISESTYPARLQESEVQDRDRGAVMTSLACVALPGMPRRLPRSCGEL